MPFAFPLPDLSNLNPIELVSFLTIIAVIMLMGIFVILRPKATIFFLERDGNDYFFVKKKKLYRLKDQIHYKNKTFLLHEPTYRHGRQKIYIFEANSTASSSYPLTLKDISPISAEELDFFVRSSLLTKLASAVNPNQLQILTLVIGIVIGALLGYFIGQYYHAPTTTTTTPPPTSSGTGTTPPPTPSGTGSGVP